MNKKPIISVIVPVYNVENYLKGCLESLVNQTLYDIEIICVNDGSTDKSLDILNKYRKQDSRIILVNKANEGVSIARNDGLRIAGGGYVVFVDADDYVEKCLCERLYEVIVQTNTDIIVYGAEIFPKKAVEYESWLLDTLKVKKMVYSSNCEKALFNEKCSKPFVWNKCYKRDLLYNNNIWFHKDIRLGEDNLFQFMVFPRAHEVVFIEDVLYNYRCIREDSAMYKMRNNIEWKIQMHIEIMKNVFASWQDIGILQRYANELYRWCEYFVIKEIEKCELPICRKNVFLENVETELNRYGFAK